MAKQQKKDSKSAGIARRRRRRLLTFWRMCKYGLSNFTRNAWLTIAATVVMVITLSIVLVTLIAQNVLSDTTDYIVRERLDRSIYLLADTQEDQADEIIRDLNRLENVESVRFISSSEAKSSFAKERSDDKGVLEAINLANNKIPATIHINLVDPLDTSQLVSFVKNNQPLKEYIDPDRSPNFIGDRKTPIDTIASWTKIAQEVGIGASIIFTAISMLIIFNTIRMAIFNRSDEIEMMKLIGAEKSFIRGPFVVEAIVYGLVAAFIATGLGVVLMYSLRDKVADWGIMIQPTIELYLSYIGVVLIGMILVGALVGVVSSLLATRRYLKI